MLPYMNLVWINQWSEREYMSISVTQIIHIATSRLSVIGRNPRTKSSGTDYSDGILALFIDVYIFTPLIYGFWHYRESKTRRNMLKANPKQGQVLCCQIWDRRRKRRITLMGPNVYTACINVLLNHIQWYLSLFKSIFFFYWYPFLVRSFGLRR